MEEKKPDFECPTCKGTGIIRFAGLIGKNSGLTAPCDHCQRGAEEKIRMENRRR